MQYRVCIANIGNLSVLPTVRVLIYYAFLPRSVLSRSFNEVSFSSRFTRDGTRVPCDTKACFRLSRHWKIYYMHLFLGIKAASSCAFIQHNLIPVLSRTRTSLTRLLVLKNLPESLQDKTLVETVPRT